VPDNYLDVLRLLEPSLRSGGIIASDNTDHEGMEAWIMFAIPIVDTSVAILTAGAHRPRGRDHHSKLTPRTGESAVKTSIGITRTIVRIIVLMYRQCLVRVRSYPQ